MNLIFFVRHMSLVAMVLQGWRYALDNSQYIDKQKYGVNRKFFSVLIRALQMIFGQGTNHLKKCDR